MDKLIIWRVKNKIQITLKNAELCLTVGKTLFKFNYNINGNVLERCTMHKDLRIIMDTGLSFIQHIEHVVSDAVKALSSVIRDTRDFNNLSCIRFLVYSLVKTKSEYCCIVRPQHHKVYINLLISVLRKFCASICILECMVTFL